MNQGSAMRRHTCLWLAAAYLFVAASASAGVVSDGDRFRLWTACAPVAEIVHGLDGDCPSHLSHLP